MKKKAIILIGFQKDYFSPDGILYNVVEESLSRFGILDKTVNIIENAIQNDTLVILTPIVFSDNYSELENPVGILKIIKDVGAFKAGTEGVKTIGDLSKFKENILEIPGKQGLNAFVNTNLEEVLKQNQIEEVVLVGCVCSICIDSTGRAAAEKGFSVTMISDCISSRTPFEHEFYTNEVFPLYANVTEADNFIKS